MRSLLRSAAGLLLGVVIACGIARSAAADTAVLTHEGVLYEVLVARYADIIPGAAGTSDAPLPVVAIRTTRPGHAPVLELVDGTVNQADKGSPSIGFDEATGSLFVTYMRYQGALSDLHFAVKRAGAWSETYILASAGLFLSLNPQMVVTRQAYVDLDPRTGTPLAKTRSIVSIIWWEEGGRSQARYAPVFLEDGLLHLDEITAYNLNELAGGGGPTSNLGLPFSAYQFPAVQRDPLNSGGVLVSFANLATRRQNVLRIGFPDDMQQIIASGVPPGSEADARIHSPIGRNLVEGQIPSGINTTNPVGTVIAPTSLVATFFWTDAAAVHVLPDDVPEDTPDTTIVLRPDLTLDRAISIVREMALAH